MSIASVTARIDGVSYPLTLNSETGKYEATITAPYASSFTQTGGYFYVRVTVKNTAGKQVMIDSRDETFGENLRLFVRENVPPVITPESHQSGCYFSELPIRLTFTALDNINGQSSGYSGINAASARVIIDNIPQRVNLAQNIEGGYRFTFVSDLPISEGEHSARIGVSDNDGNYTWLPFDFCLDLNAPSLSVSYPHNGDVINDEYITVTGTSGDSVTSQPFVSVSVNGQPCGFADFVSENVFEKRVHLTEGTNTVAVTASDSSGKSVTVSKSVTLDSYPPVFHSVTLSPDSTDAGGAYVISVEVE